MSETIPPVPPPRSNQPVSDKALPPPPPGIWKGWVRPLLTVLLVVTALRSSLVDWNDVPTGSMEPTIMPGDRIVVSKLSYALNLPFNGPTLPIPFLSPKKHPRNPLDFLPGFYYDQPERNEIVTFWKPGTFYQVGYDILIDAGASEEGATKACTIDDAGIRMVKRIVAQPGDTIELRPATLDVNGKPYHYSKLTLNGEAATYTMTGGGLVESIHGIQRHVQYMRNSAVRDARGQLMQFPVDPRSVSFGPVTLGEDEYLMIGDNRDNSQDGRFFGPVTLKQITGHAKFIAVAFDGGYTKPKWSRFFQGLD